MIAKIDGGESVERHINDRCIRCLNTGELLHWRCATVRTKAGLATNPVSTFLGNRALGKFVIELNFKLAAVKAAFAFKLGNMVLTMFFVELVGGFARNKSG